MSDQIEKMTVVAENTTLPLMLWRRYRRPMPGLAEDTLTRNPWLADLGPVLPVGTQFDARVETDTARADQAAVLAPIRLW